MSRWQRTLYIMFFARLVTAVGFSIVFPFLPLYVDFLGTNTNLSVEFLAGAVFSAQAFTMMIASPIWGAVADRYGRKLMVARSMFGGTLIIGLMAFVTSAEQLVLLRAIQGCITGVASATNALVASVTPRERTGYAMGLMQLATWSGVAVGPVMGGVMADTLGFSTTFLATAALLFIAGVLVWLGIEEDFTPSEKTKAAQQAGIMSGWRNILAAPGVTTTYMLRFTSWMGRTMIVPIAPLVIINLMGPNADNIASLTGLMTGVAAAAGTLSALYFGRLGDKIGHETVFVWGATFTAFLYIPQFFVNDVWQLVVLQGLTGAGAGTVLPSLSALLAKFTTRGEEGAVYGLENSIMAASRTISPMVGPAIAVWFGLRSTFLLAALLFFISVLIARYQLPGSGASGSSAKSAALLPSSPVSRRRPA